MDIDGNLIIETLKLQRNAALDALAMADTERQQLQTIVEKLQFDLVKATEGQSESQ